MVKTVSKESVIAYEVRELTAAAAKTTKKTNADGSIERTLKTFDKKEEAEGYKTALDKDLENRLKTEKAENEKDGKKESAPAADSKS